MATRAVIFDCFGVLVSCKLPQLFAQYTANDPQKRQQFHALSQSADRGYISSTQYWEQVAALMGLNLATCRQVVDAERHHNYDLLAYIRELKGQQYKIGLLSNAGKDIWDYLTPDIQELFDVRLISADLGRCKPDQEVFLEACRQLGVAPEEAVMVDDSEANCTGAQQAGLCAVRYHDYTQLRGELSDALVVLA
jgi:putative hydrolase of the HAD superfamily